MRKIRQASNFFEQLLFYIDYDHPCNYFIYYAKCVCLWMWILQCLERHSFITVLNQSSPKIKLTRIVSTHN